MKAWHWYESLAQKAMRAGAAASDVSSRNPLVATALLHGCARAGKQAAIQTGLSLYQLLLVVWSKY